MQSLIALRHRLAELDSTLAKLEEERIGLINEIAGRLRRQYEKPQIFLVLRRS